MTQETGLATRSETERLRKRLELGQLARFGRAQDLSPAQANVIILLAQRYGLDPLTDITPFEGQPFITGDGWYRIMRRDPEYAGHSLRPLIGDEKAAWGYEPDDLVILCAIRTRSRGVIDGRGAVRAAEVKRARDRAAQSGKRSAPIGTYITEIAEKRAIARAARVAFGLEVPEEAEQIDLAARQVEVFGTEESTWPIAPGDDLGSIDPEPHVSEPGEDAGELGWAEAAAPKQEPEPAPVDASPEPGDPPVTVYSCAECDVPLYHPDGTAVTKEEAEAMQKRYGAVLCKKHQKGR